METRAIGPLEVSLLGLGCNQMGRNIDQKQSELVVHAALDHGITFFDTADSYGDSNSERFLGSALRGVRKNVVIATKFGRPFNGERGGGAPEYVHRSVRQSLARLQTDYIDLYQIHVPDPTVPIEETFGALVELVTSGLILAVGHSNFDAPLIDSASTLEHDGIGFVSAQNEWNLLQRSIETDVLPAVARSNDLKVIPFHPLAAGLLTGKYRYGEEPDSTWRMGPINARLRDERLHPDVLKRVEVLRSFADRSGYNLLELALTWLASRSQVGSIIAGATKPEQVASNVAAMNVDIDEGVIKNVGDLELNSTTT